MPITWWWSADGGPPTGAPSWALAHPGVGSHPSRIIDVHGVPAALDSEWQPSRHETVRTTQEFSQPGGEEQMTHRAAAYTVRVRPKYDRTGEVRLLGDIDEEGTSLISVLENCFKDLESTSDDESKVVRCLSCTLEDDDLLLIAQHGQNGVAADIVDTDGGLRLRQQPEDTQLLRCGSLFRLPLADATGWLAVHVNNGRGIKSLLQKGIVDRFRDDYPKLIIDITPFVEPSVLKEAVDHDRIDKVKLVKFEQPNDRAALATSRWVPAGAVGRLELDISTRGKAARVLSGVLQRFMGGDLEAFHEIVEFQNITFDEAKVEVVLDGGARRTFNIEKPDSGHPFTEDLGDLVMENGEPTSESLFEGLRSVLKTVST